MSTIQPDRIKRTAAGSTIALGHIGLHGVSCDIVCDACKRTTVGAVLLVRDWEPTLAFCAACVSERLDPR